MKIKKKWSSEISNTPLAPFYSFRIGTLCTAMQDSAADTNASVMSPPQVQCQFERAFMKYVWT